MYTDIIQNNNNKSINLFTSMLNINDLEGFSTKKNNLVKKNKNNKSDDIREDFKDPFKKIGKDIKKSTKKMEKDIKKSDPFKDMIKFFNDIDKFFKKVKEAFTFTKEKTTAILLTIIIPFFGQIIARFMLLNGSLDKPWLLLFGIPPLTLIPALFMMFGLVAKGKGGKPWDYYVLIPIIINIISGFILKNYGIMGQIIKYIVLLLSFIYIYWLKSQKICKKSARYTKIITDSLITYCLMEVIKIVLEYVPLIGIIIKVIGKTIPFGYLILDAISILCVYVITNMINSYDSKNFCKKEVKNKYIGLLILISIMMAYKNYSLLNKKIE